MNQDHIRYDLLVQEALKGVVRQVLTDAAEQGLPGEHHFYVSFRTVDPGVRISQRLREKYPEEMTIVLQHQFWDLSVNEHAFEVGLSFSGIPERLLVPFDALTGFFDPSVQFGLKFELSGAEPADNDHADAEEETAVEPPPAPTALPLPVKKDTREASRKAADKAASEKPAKDAPEAEKAKTGKAGKKDDPAVEAPAGDGAQVVRLDAFRKKP
ncbi:SspB family protein [uncultured Alsobacter sp.]|uniref:SspB family protein n=1 Tax=uncultured Alsobacter sp. TaxID=1748258 RepID=UPI0025F340EA|nr:ClpXP protease specificity-enhancing factor SspB [uncultured Alsobacter sp.]